MFGKSRFPFFHLSTESRPTLKRNHWNRSGRNWPDGVIEEERIVAIGWTPPTARRCLKVGRDEWRKPREQRVRGLGRVGSTLRRNANFHLAAFLVGRQCSWLDCRLSMFSRLIVKPIVRWRIVQLFLSLSILFLFFISYCSNIWYNRLYKLSKRILWLCLWKLEKMEIIERKLNNLKIIR